MGKVFLLKASSLARSFLLPHARPLPCPSVPSESIYEQTSLRQCSVVTTTCWRVYAYTIHFSSTLVGEAIYRGTRANAYPVGKWPYKDVLHDTAAARVSRRIVLNVLHGGNSTHIEQRFTCTRTHVRAGYPDAGTHICTRVLVGRTYVPRSDSRAIGRNGTCLKRR